MRLGARVRGGPLLLGHRGIVGLGVNAAGVEAQFARDPWPYAIAMCGIGDLFLAFGLLALALVRPSGWVVPRRAALAAAWVVAAGLVLYAATGVVDVLRLIGVMGSPVERSVLWGNLLVWNPWWLLGAALFFAAAWYNRRGLRGEARHFCHRSNTHVYQEGRLGAEGLNFSVPDDNMSRTQNSARPVNFVTT